MASLVVMGWYLVNTDRYVDEHPGVSRGDGEYRPAGARGDGHMYYLLARSLVFDRDVDLDNDLRRFGDPFNSTTTVTGLRHNTHAIGVPLVWTSVLVAAQGLAAIGNLLGAAIEMHGYTPFHIKLVLITSPLAAILAVGLAFVMARRRGAGPWSAAYGAAGILLASPLVYYAALMPSYSHAIDAGAVALLLFVWQRDVGSMAPRRALMVGAMLGGAALVRHQNILLGVVLLVDVVQWLAHRETPLRTRVRRLVVAAALAAGAATLVFTPQLIVGYLTFGDVMPQPVAPNFMRPRHPFVVELLFSSRGGWVSLTPLVGGGLIGLALAPRGHRHVAIGLALVVLSQLYVNASAHDWWGAAAFGARRMSSMTLPIAVGLAWLLAAGGRLASRRRLPSAAQHALALIPLAWFVTWNLAYASRFTGMRTASASTGELPSKRLPPFMRAIAEPIARRIGNPFSLPASVPFALAHDVPLRRYTDLVGEYPLVGDVLVGRGLVETRAGWPLIEPRGERYIAAGLGAVEERAGRKARRVADEGARLLLPMLEPVPHRVALTLHAAVATDIVVWWEGTQVAHGTIGPGWDTLTFHVGFARVGEMRLAPSGPDLFLGGAALAITP